MAGRRLKNGALRVPQRYLGGLQERAKPACETQVPLQLDAVGKRWIFGTLAGALLIHLGRAHDRHGR
jgi:hypothetical protein